MQPIVLFCTPIPQAAEQGLQAPTCHLYVLQSEVPHALLKDCVQELEDMSMCAVDIEGDLTQMTLNHSCVDRLLMKVSTTAAVFNVVTRTLFRHC